MSAVPKLHVETVGAGPPMILTHGLGDSSSTWDALWPSLATHHTVTRWDLRGHGKSDAPVEPEVYSPGIAATDLLEIIGRSTEPVTLVGHSLGGYLSLAVALRHPDLVRSVATISAGPGFRDPVARAGWNRYIDEVAATMMIPTAAARLAHQVDASVIGALPSLSCPLTQIIGQLDHRFHAGADYIQKRAPVTSTHLVIGARHHPQRTNPGAVLAILGQATGFASTTLQSET